MFLKWTNCEKLTKERTEEQRTGAQQDFNLILQHRLDRYKKCIISFFNEEMYYQGCLINANNDQKGYIKTSLNT